MLTILSKRRATHKVSAVLGIESGHIGYIGKLGPLRVLRQRGHQILLLSEKYRQLRRSKNGGICARSDVLPLSAGQLRGFVVFSMKRDADWPRLFAELHRVVAHQGKIVVVAKASAMALSRGALCGGLTNIRQQFLGSWVITSGRAKKYFSQSRPMVREEMPIPVPSGQSFLGNDLRT